MAPQVKGFCTFFQLTITSFWRHARSVAQHVSRLIVGTGHFWAASGTLQVVFIVSFTILPLNMAVATVLFTIAAIAIFKWRDLLTIFKRYFTKVPAALAVVEGKTSLDFPFDCTTGLRDVQWFQDRCTEKLRSASKNHRILALVAIDIDRMADINACHGYAFGDELLRITAERLAQSPFEYISRTGGDRFMVLMDNIRSVEDVEFHLAAILDRIAVPIMKPGESKTSVNASASAGVALYPQHGSKFASLARFAEMAAQTAKLSGRRRYRFFQPQMMSRLTESHYLEADLRKALDRQELDIVYQPQYSLLSGELLGFEALMRWNHPKKGRVSPSVFIPIAEASGLICQIGEWLIDEVFKQTDIWNRNGQYLSVAINLSVAQLRQKNLLKLIEYQLGRYSLSPSQIEFELTESLFVDPSEVALRRSLDELDGMGIRLAIDDFGTGFSSLAYLKRLPVKKIKIDKSFVNGLGTDLTDLALVRTIIAIAHTFEKTVLAEGIENPRQYDILKQEGCDQAQGYYLSRPVSVEACNKLLSHSWRNAPAPKGMAKTEREISKRIITKY